MWIKNNNFFNSSSKACHILIGLWANLNGDRIMSTKDNNNNYKWKRFLANWKSINAHGKGQCEYAHSRVYDKKSILSHSWWRCVVTLLSIVLNKYVAYRKNIAHIEKRERNRPTNIWHESMIDFCFAILNNCHWIIMQFYFIDQSMI